MLKLRYLLSLSLAGALLLGACGGDDDDDTGDDSPNGDATSTVASDATKTSDQPTTASGDKTAEATKPAATPSPESANSTLEKLALEAVKSTYQAKYDIEIAFSGETQKGTAVFANKAPKFASIITLTAAGAGSIKLSVINDGTATYVCSDFGLGGNCSKDTSDIAAGADVKKALEEATKGRQVKEVGGRTIAGRSARCFEATDTTTNSVTTYCIDSKDSIMLALETSGAMKLTATEVESSVDEKLFELPFPVN